MQKADKRKMFMQYRDSLKSSNVRELEKLLTDTDMLLYDYADYLRVGSFEDVIADVKRFNFRECCAYLTFIMRFEYLEGNWYDKCVKDGSIRKILERLLEVM